MKCVLQKDCALQITKCYNDIKRNVHSYQYYCNITSETGFYLTIKCQGNKRAMMSVFLCDGKMVRINNAFC